MKKALARVKKTAFVFLLLVFILPLNAQTISTPEYLHYHFENGSPLFWDVQEDGSVLVSLIYDHERNSPNRATLHWHFQVYADQGSRVKLILQNFENVWNGRPSVPIKENNSCFISVDGINWEVVPTIKTPENRLIIEFDMPAASVYISRLEPYRISDLQRLLAEIENHPLARISVIGQTVKNRPLEIIRIGSTSAPRRVFIRARAHPWETGGNWVVEGMIRKLLSNEADAVQYMDQYCVYILPMANKDGVALGRSRFNLRGKDLNRDWDEPADPYLCPENAALERWLAGMIDGGLKPDLAIDFHNDAGGRLHISRPNINLETYLEKMEVFESLLRRHTWFTEGSTGSNFRNPGSIGEGLLERYGIDALVYELNANWIGGLQKVPSGKDWMLLGEQLCDVFGAYFKSIEDVDLIEGAADLHVHTAPDVAERSINDIELARMTVLHSMRAVVIKSHAEGTASRAEVANLVVGKPVVYGGIVLNSQVGGLNPEAVQAMARLSPDYGKIVWMPTRDAAYGKPEGQGITILNENGGVIPQIHEILEIIVDHDLVLATGHLSPREIKVLVDEAYRKGIRKILLTHPLSLADPPGIPELKSLVAKGAMIELTYNSQISRRDPLSYDHVVSTIREIGSKHFILTSDMGQPGNPTPVEGLRAMIRELTHRGILADEIRTMTRTNPCDLLGIE